MKINTLIHSRLYFKFSRGGVTTNNKDMKKSNCKEGAITVYCTCDIMTELFGKSEWQAVGVQLSSQCYMWVIQYFTPLSLTPVITTVAGQGGEEKQCSWREEKRFGLCGSPKFDTLSTTGILYDRRFRRSPLPSSHQKSHWGLETSMWFGFTALTGISDPKLKITRAIMET